MAFRFIQQQTKKTREADLNSLHTYMILTAQKEGLCRTEHRGLLEQRIKSTELVDTNSQNTNITIATEGSCMWRSGGALL